MEMEMGFRVEVTYYEGFLYTVTINGETVLECMGADDIASLTLKELKEIAVEAGIIKK